MREVSLYTLKRLEDVLAIGVLLLAGTLFGWFGRELAYIMGYVCAF